MKKKIGLVLVGLCWLFSGCKVDVKVENEEPVIEEENIQDVGFFAIEESRIDLKYSHCFERVILKWKNPEGGTSYRILLSCGEDSYELEGLPGEYQEYRFTNIPKGIDTEFYIAVYDDKDELYTEEQVVTYAGHGKIIKKGETKYKSGDSLSNSFTVLRSVSQSGANYETFYVYETIVIPPETEVQVAFEDGCGDSAGNFHSEVKTMKPYAMTKYELSSDLVSQLNGGAYQQSSRQYPKVNVSFMEALVACNQLTKRLMSEKDCVYFKDRECTVVLDSVPYSSVFYIRPGAKGYRLPTWEEWEFAARSGDYNSREWNNPFSGTGLYAYSLEDIAVLGKFSGIGTKKPNGLGIYDMTGNVREFVLDYKNTPLSERNDSLECYESYTVGTCGGSYMNSFDSEELLNSHREILAGDIPIQYGFIDYALDLTDLGRDGITGIRLVRSL